MKYEIIETNEKYNGPKIKVASLKIKINNDHFVHWDKVMFRNFIYGIPITENREVLLVQEWRPGPEKILTLFVGAGYSNEDPKKELARELSEEIGLTGGDYRLIIKDISNGPHLGGFKSIYIIEDFSLGMPAPEEDENIKIIKIPLINLYSELSKNYATTSETLLGAKLVQEILL